MDTEYMNSLKKKKKFKTPRYLRASLDKERKSPVWWKKDSPRKKEARVLSPADFISMNSLRKSIVNSSFD